MNAICSWDGDHVRQIVALTVSADWSREIQAFRVYETKSLRRSKHCKIEALHIFVFAFVFKTWIGGPAPRLHRVYARRLDPVARVSKEFVEGKHRRACEPSQSESRSRMIAQDDRSGGQT